MWLHLIYSRMLSELLYLYSFFSNVNTIENFFTTRLFIEAFICMLAFFLLISKLRASELLKLSYLALAFAALSAKQNYMIFSFFMGLNVVTFWPLMNYYAMLGKRHGRYSGLLSFIGYLIMVIGPYISAFISAKFREGLVIVSVLSFLAIPFSKLDLRLKRRRDFNPFMLIWILQGFLAASKALRAYWVETKLGYEEVLQIGKITSVVTFISVLTSLLLGELTDRFGFRKEVVKFSGVVSVVLYPFLLFSSGKAFLFIYPLFSFFFSQFETLLLAYQADLKLKSYTDMLVRDALIHFGHVLAFTSLYFLFK